MVHLRLLSCVNVRLLKSRRGGQKRYCLAGPGDYPLERLAWGVRVSDEWLTGSYSGLAGLLLDHASRVLVLAQSDKFRMSQPISFGPF